MRVLECGRKVVMAVATADPAREKQPAAAGAESGRTVTSKVLAILGAFESTTGPLALTQIAESANLPLPTAHRLVGELVEWGALERDDLARYSIGMRLWEVSQQGGRQLRDTARPFLQDLFSLTQETSHLAVREGREALYVDRVYSSKRVPRASRVGGRLPLHATAVGKVLLASEAEWIREAYLSQPLEKLTGRTQADPRQLRRELARVAEQGYATTHEEVRAGSCSIAVPVLLPDGKPVAAIGLVMLSTQARNMTRYLPPLRGIATRIGTAIAHTPGALRLSGLAVV